MKFRKDINGLRAFAVIAVVLFHFNASWMPGGFAGVDVFFVISGFLMTGIIFNGFEQNNFSVLKFYVARANRIIPALAALCFVLLVFGWFFITPLDYTALAKHVAGSMSFLSNIIYWRESGYFDAASHEKWLLHTWSLSVEWQFYILYPLVLVALKRFMSLNAIKVTLLVGTFLCFVFSVFVSYKRPELAYYLLPTRAWEMMIGGVALLYPFTLTDNKKKTLEWIGLGLIFSSFIFVSKESVWPGYLALIPVLGTFLIIQAQRKNSIVTGNIVFQYLGKWSYSIYLWHWPLVVAIYYFSLNEQFIFAGIVLSVALGFLSYKYIESIKFKNDFSQISSYLKCKPIYLAIIVGGLGGYTLVNRGFEWHYPEEVLLASYEAINTNPHKCMVEEKFPCYIGNTDNIKAILIGDSHADALATSFANAFDLEESGVVALAKGSCPFILGINSIISGTKCLEENERRLKLLNEKYSGLPIFWVARSSVYIKGQSNPNRVNDVRDTKPLIYFSEKKYEKVTDELLGEIDSALQLTLNKINKGRDIFIVLPTPEMRKNVPNTISRSFLLGNKVESISIDKSLYMDRNKEVIALFRELSSKVNNVTLLDPTLYLCENDTCYGTHNGRPIYYDGDHLSEFGNKLLTPMFLSVVN